MKTFVISAVLFAILLGTILLNCLFVDRTMDTLEKELSALPECTAASAPLDALTSYWEACHNALSFSISFAEIRAMDDCLTQLRIAAQHGNAYSFELAREGALDVIGYMRRLECFSFDGIF